MTTWRDKRAAKSARDRAVETCLRAGASNEEASRATGLGVSSVGRLRRFLGLALAQSTTGVTSRSRLAQMREECERRLGAQMTDALAPESDPVEIQRLHAALRCVLLEAEPLLEAVRERFRVMRAEELVERATAQGMGGCDI